jgi:hypothetical protein
MAMPIGSPAQRRMEELAPLGEATYRAWSAWALAARESAIASATSPAPRPLDRLAGRPDPA